MRLRDWLPATEWIRNYRKEWLSGDLSAGLTVGVMLIPQGMAYALLAGLPLIHGLYAATLPIILYALLGSSRQLAVGPVAMDSLLTAVGIGAIATVGTANYIALAASLALLVGFLQWSAGTLRLGFLVDLLSRPVISGFTSAAALIIGVSQLPHILGFSLDGSPSFFGRVWAAITGIPQSNLYTLALGLGGIVFILLLKRINRRLPAPLFIVVLAILIVNLWDLDTLGVLIVGEIPSGLPPFGVQLPEWEQIQALIPTAVAIAMVSFMESIAVGKTVQRRHGDYEIDPNQELKAIGAANMGNALVSGYPGAGGFSRTAVNDQAGAKTQLAGLISAGLIVLTLLFLTPLFYYLPNAVLASIILVAVSGLIDWREFQRLWRVDRPDFWLLVIAFSATLLLGIQWGIGLGVLLSLAVHVYRSMRPHLAVLGRIPGTEVYRNLSRFENLEDIPGYLIVRFDGPLYFGNVSYFKQRLKVLIGQNRVPLKAVVISGEGMASVDSTAMAELSDLTTQLNNRNIEVRFAGLIGPVRDRLKKARLTEQIGKDKFYVDVTAAVKGEQRAAYALQTNI